MTWNLRHLRVFLSIIEHGSMSRAAASHNVSQPAVSQAAAKLERAAGVQLLHHGGRGPYPTPAGVAFAERLKRVFTLLDPPLAELGPRVVLTTTSTRLRMVIALCETENFTLAARRLRLAQPTVHRAIGQLEREADRPLFERSALGIIATRPALALAQAARLAFAELNQATAELSEMAGREAVSIVVGAMPLARSHLLPRAIARFGRKRESLSVKVADGPYEDLLARLRRGEIDILVGAIRNPAPIGDIVQEVLFQDNVVIVARPGHPMLAKKRIALAQLCRAAWVVNHADTPIRRHFDRLFGRRGPDQPSSIVESSSLILMRELLRNSDHLGFISRLQVTAEIADGTLSILPFQLKGTSRPIGLTHRKGWLPTQGQRAFVAELYEVAGTAPLLDALET